MSSRSGISRRITTRLGSRYSRPSKTARRAAVSSMRLPMYADEVEPEFALEALLHDLQVEQAQEPEAEAESQRDRALGLIADRGVVEVQLVDRIAQERVVVAPDRIDPREDQALGRLVPGKWGLGGARGARERVAHPGGTHALQTPRDGAHLAP